MQVYTQLKIKLNYTIICYLPIKLQKTYSKSIILLIIKLLYSLTKAKNY